MKISMPRVQRTAGVVLASALLVSSLLAWGPQTVLAQAGTPAAPVMPAASKMVVVGANGATLYTEPQGDEISSLPLGSVLTAAQRTADSQWIAVRTDEGVTGWVQAADIVAFGLEQLPVAGENGAATPAAAAAQPAATKAAPTVAPTATPTEEPSPTPLPTATPEPTATPAPPTPTSSPTAAATATKAAAQTPATAATAATAATTTAAAPSARNLIAVVGGTGADLYDMPGGAKVQALPMAATVTAALRNRAGDWVFVTTTDGASGWTQAAGLVAFGLDRLPVLDVTADEGEAAPAQAVAAGEAAEPAAAQGAETGAAETAASATVALPVSAGVPATVTITEQRLNIRSGPGSDYRIIEKARPGEVLTATARTADSAWVQVARDDLENGVGWVSTEFLAVQDLAGLPMDDSFAAAEGDTPTAAATAVPAATPAPTAMEENGAAGAAGTGSSTDSAGADSEDNVALPTATSIPAAPVSTEPAATSADTAALQPASDAEAAQVMEMAGANALAPAAAISAQPAGLSGKLVFQDGRNNIYVYNLETGDVRWLTNGFDPAVSPDGSRVTFVRGGGDVNGVWTINSDGSGERHIHGGGEIMRGPKWSPDGKWIVFSRNNTNWKCFDLEFFGCVSFFELQGKFPQIPPPILYRIFIRGADRLEFPNWIITRINADGGEFRDLNALDSAVSPDWNEAGIVYQAKPGLEITEDTPDGRTRSVQHDGWDWDPDWQPGGGRIVYQSKEGSHWEIWSINPDGSGVFALTHPETTLVDQLPSNVAPAFSPDGQNIVYLSNRTEDEEAGPWRLWVMDSGGGSKRPLPIDITIDYGFSSDQVASWAQ